MSGHMPPVPPASQPRKGPKDTQAHPTENAAPEDRRNTEDQGQQGNTYQNTHGHPQSR